MTVRELKNGDLFHIEGSKVVYIRGLYDKSIKRYSCVRFDDVNRERYLLGNKEVITDFEF